MRHPIRELCAVLTALGVIMAAPPVCEAQGGRQIKIVVPFAPGGGVDVFARLLADQLKHQIDATIVVENRGGANGTIGGIAVRNAAPDGANLLFSAATHVMARQVMKTPPYDPITDFTPIARVGEAPMLLVMAPDLAPKSIAELIAEARKAPDKWNFATSAVGSPGYLAMVDFNRLAKLNLTIVAYRGTAPGLTDVAGGHVQLMVDPVLALLPMAVDNKVKGLAVLSPRRTRLAPQFPTAAESGLPGLEHASWYGVWGPKDVAPDLVAKLNATINDAIRALDKDGRLTQIGVDPVTETPAEFAAYAAAYVGRSAELLKAANFEPL